MMNRKQYLTKSVLILILIMIIGLVLQGCASPPSGGEFKKETPPSTKTSKEESEKKTTPGKIEGYEIYENQDPFQPKVGEGAAATVTTATTTTDIGQLQTTTAQVNLVSISPEGTAATINVDGTEYADVTVGTEFGGAFKLVSIGTGSVEVLYGDNQYTLYLGETLTLK